MKNIFYLLISFLILGCSNVKTQHDINGKVTINTSDDSQEWDDLGEIIGYMYQNIMPDYKPPKYEKVSHMYVNGTLYVKHIGGNFMYQLKVGTNKYSITRNYNREINCNAYITIPDEFYNISRDYYFNVPNW